MDAGLLEDRFARGELLHQQLAEVAEELWGVDADQSGIHFLEEHGFSNVITADVCRPEWLDAVKGQHFEVIVASEVVEHLMNPGMFLENIQKVMHHGETQLLVTVPNAFRLDTLHQLLQGIELVHPDHNYWFSYHTICNLLQKSGLQIDQVMVYSFRPSRLAPLRGTVTRLLRGGRTTSPSVTDEPSPVGSGRLVEKAQRYLSSLPGRLVTRQLYKRSPFWGDGLILFASRPSKEG